MMHFLVTALSIYDGYFGREGLSKQSYCAIDGCRHLSSLDSQFAPKFETESNEANMER